MLWVISDSELGEDGKVGFYVERTVANRLGKTIERWFETREEAEGYKARLEVILIEQAANQEPYGDVEYADPGYQKDGKKRYPVDTAEHVRSAWSYINHPHNEAMYTPQQVTQIKGKIRSAAKKLGVDISG